MEYLDIEDVKYQIRRLLSKVFMTNKEAALSFGISESYLSDILSGRRQPGEKILFKLGLKKEIVYRELTNDDMEYVEKMLDKMETK